jgi:hypothetical protein
MQAERWKQIEELYQAALAQPPEKRAAFLAQACPDDPQLRGEVQSLLDQQADSFLESAPCRRSSAERGREAGQLRDCGTAGPRRHGRGLARPRCAVEARRGHQGAARRLGARPRSHRPFRAGSPRGQRAQPPQHRRRLRHRLRQRHLLDRFRIGPRGHPAAHDRARPASPAEGNRDCQCRWPPASRRRTRPVWCIAI